jgi:hypothetical protein
MEWNETSVGVVAISAEERAEEQKLIRRLQMLMNMVMQVIAQDASLTIDDASQMIAAAEEPRWPCSPAKSLPMASSGSLASNASCENDLALCSCGFT